MRGEHDPRPCRFRGLPRTTLLGFTVPVATTRASRLLGLALLDLDRAGEGLLIPGCRGVHTFGMRFSLDLLFLADDGRVLRLDRAVPARRIVRCAGAGSVLELPGECSEGRGGESPGASP